MDCINDPDISIRLQALELGAGMVTSDNLVTIVERLLQQLSSAPTISWTADDEKSHALGVEPAADAADEDPEEVLKPTAEHNDLPAALPAEYRVTIIRQIISLCSKDTYTNIIDFEWYIDVLLQLVRLVPASLPESIDHIGQQEKALGDVIGWELRNVAVRVTVVRKYAVAAAYSLISTYGSDSSVAVTGTGGEGVLTFAAWLVGEYYSVLAPSNASLEPLIHPRVYSLSPAVISTYLQAIPKVLCAIVSCGPEWSVERQTMVSLLVARIIHFIEPLNNNPDVDVQERSVEFLELMRILFQSISNHQLETNSGPLLLTTAIPQLFNGFELNPVAPAAQRKVPLPSGLELEMSINKDLGMLLQRAEQDVSLEAESVGFELFYNQRASPKATNSAIISTLPSLQFESISDPKRDGALLQSDALPLETVRRRERNKDDPFHIVTDDAQSDTSTPFHDILRNTNGDDLDVDSIPIMSLDIGKPGTLNDESDREVRKMRHKHQRKVHIIKDENIEHEADNTIENQAAQATIVENLNHLQRGSKKSLLQVDSSGLDTLSLDASLEPFGLLHPEALESQDTEMAQALAKVERLRLEMQRAHERIEAKDGTPAEGVLVKKKKRKKPKQQVNGAPVIADQTTTGASQDLEDREFTPVIEKKKKKKKKTKKETERAEAGDKR